MPECKSTRRRPSYWWGDLPALWNQTDPVLTVAQIGERLGITKKSTIVGRARALGLPSRNPGRTTDPVYDESFDRLWRDEKLTAAQIAERLGRSKNAVIGAAFRRGLMQSRYEKGPDDIRTPFNCSEPIDLRNPERKSAPNLPRNPNSTSAPNTPSPPLPVSEPNLAQTPETRERADQRKESDRPKRAALPKKPSKRQRTLVLPQPRTCQWLHGEPHERNFCGQSTVNGGSWCQEHRSRVFLRDG